MSSIHSFHIEAAVKFGSVEKAIIFQHILYWVEFNQRAKKNKHQGKTWMYQTQKEMANHFPYWNRDKIKRILKQLVEEGYILKSNFNKKGFDQTNWYTVVNKETPTIGRKRPLENPGDSPGVGESAHPVDESAQPVDESAQPIPKSKTDTKTDAKKNNVKTLPFSTNNKENFYKALSADQKRVHDKLVRFKPSSGEKLESKTVCAWMLAKKYTVEQIEQAFKVYLQDCDEAAKAGREINSIGAYMCKAIKEGRKLKNADFQTNLSFAKAKTAAYKFLELTKRYVKIALNSTSEQISFDLPHVSFVTTLESYIRKAELEVA